MAATMRTRTVLLAAAAFWAAFAVFVATELYLVMLDHGHSYARILAWQLAAWQPWALASPLLAWGARRVPLLPISARGAFLHATCAVALGSAHVAWYVGLQLWMRPYDAMTPTAFLPAFLGSLSRLHSNVVVYLATVGLVQAVEFHRRYREREVEAARLESSLAQARLEALKLQLRPHFLFNTLHAIGGLVRQGRGGAAVEMLTRMSDLLRASLGEDAAEVSLEHELELTDRYLHIQRVRFSDRLSVSVEAGAEALRARVPPLILQPLVENAFTHGIARAAGPCVLRIRATREGSRLAIEVYNSGAGLEGGRRGVGLRNTEERLRRLYGSEQRLALQDAPGGVRATLSIPFRPHEEPAA